MRTNRPKKRSKGGRNHGTRLVACPTCGAAIGERCQAPDNVRNVATHKRRINEYTTARRKGLLPQTVPQLQTLPERVRARGPITDEQRARTQANIRRELYR